MAMVQRTTSAWLQDATRHSVVRSLGHLRCPADRSAPLLLAGRAAVNPQTLRYYERRGLLAEPARSAGGYRSCPQEAVRLSTAGEI